MSSTKVKGIVLSSKDYKEKDKLVILYTLENGKLAAFMRGVRGDKAKLKAAKEPFCFAEYIIENTKGANVITQAEVIDNFFDITKDIDKFYEGCTILDIVNKVGTEADPALFLQLLKCLKALCYQSIRKYYVVNKFLIKLFTDLGYSFLTNNCSSCQGALGEKRYFNFDLGEIVCGACKNATAQAVSDACYAALKLLNTIDYDKLCSLKIGGQGEVECFRLLEKNFEWRMGTRFVTIPSL